MKIKNSFSYKKNGWTYISVKGKPHERGYAYGYYCADEFKKIQDMLKFYIFESYGDTWDNFIVKINQDFKEMTKKDYLELYQEMQGIADGCNAGGCKTNLDEIIAWNFYCSIPYWYSFTSGSHIGKEGGSKHMDMLRPTRNRANDKCSAFMAVGSEWTADGKIVVAHNSFCDFIDGQYANVILDIEPENGYRIMMQTSPCWIWSGTDFFITTGGIIGTETTIGGFQPYEKKIPIGYRIRTAMQYANSIDDYVTLLVNGDSGDYANSWLIGDIKTNEIARIELGLKFHSVSRTTNGFLIGFNAPYDPRIRNIDVVNSGFYDIRRHQGARRVRLTQLMTKYKGKLNTEIAKKIISDHYDVYLKKDNNPCSRTVCSHYDLDKREYMSQSDRPVPYAPHGALDGMICDTKMAEKMTFLGRFGNSCGTPFSKEKYCKEHIQFSDICAFLNDRPSQPWTEFSITNFDKNKYASYLKNTHIHNTMGSITALMKKIGEAPVELQYNDNKNFFMELDTLTTKYYTDDNINYTPPHKLISQIQNLKSDVTDVSNKKIVLTNPMKKQSNKKKLTKNKPTKNKPIKNKQKKNKTVKRM